MSMSGIKVSPEVSDLFNEMKSKKTKKYAIFKLSDDETKVVVDEFGQKVQTETEEEDKDQWDILKKKLEGKPPRYFLYDFRFKRKNGAIAEKLVFFLWSDDESTMKQKMLYASTKDTVKKVFNGIDTCKEVHDKEDLEYEKCKSFVDKK